MKKFKDTLILLTIAFSALFLLNTGLLYVFFGINALNPVKRVEADAHRDQAGNKAEPAVMAETEGGETKVEGYSFTGTSENPNENSDTFNASGTAEAGSGPDAGYMTSGEVQSLGELGLRDKLAALTILSKIGSSDSDRIYELAADGVTNAEMEEIKRLLESKLSQADMEELYVILDRNRKLYAEKNTDRIENGQQANAR